MKPCKRFLHQDLKIYRISFGHRRLLGRPWPTELEQNPKGDILQDWQLYGDVPPGWEKHRIQALKPHKWFLHQDLEIYRISFGHRRLLGRPCPSPHWGDIL